MGIPAVTVSVKDNSLGQVLASTGQLQAKLGTCSAGTAATIYVCNSQDDVVSQLGYGPLSDAVAYALTVAGGPVYAVPVNGSVAGAAGTATITRVGGTSTFTLTPSGAPFDAYAVVVTIVVGGTSLAAATTTFTYSLDGGKTTSSVLAMPVGGVYAIPNTGLTLTFANGAGPTSFVAGDVATLTTTAPFYSSTDATAAWNVLVADATKTWGLAHFVGYTVASTSSANASAGATLASALDTLVQTAATNNRFTRILVEAPNSIDADLISAYASFASVQGRTSVVAGTADIVSTLSGRTQVRHQAWLIAGRFGTTQIGTDLARVADGPLVGCKKLYRDENVTPGLDAARFMTCRTHTGRAGVYVTNPNTMAAAGSDFYLLQYGRIMDVACAYGRAALIFFLSDSVRVNPSTSVTPPPGSIFELDARAIEKYVDSPVRAMVVATGDATDVSIVVNRSTNLITTPNLGIKIRVTPKGYLKGIAADFGFQNPGLLLS